MGSEVVSIAFSLVALVAAAASLALQARDVFASRHQAIRSAQLDLVQMAIDNPALYLGYEPSDQERATFQHRGYVNLFIKHIELGYLTGTLGEPEARTQMSELFANPGPREAWADMRAVWTAEATSAAKRRFVHVVDDEYRLIARPELTAGDGPD